MMRQKYLKIGEFSRLTGVSVKSLRYYDHIGVLPPAYTNEETGYRYYAPEQMILLDIIRLCLTFHLPLKALSSTGGASSPDLRRLICEGEAQAQKKLREAEKMLRLSRDILEQIDRLDHPRREKELYFHDFSARCFLLAPWNEGTDTGKNYIDKIAVLHERARSRDLTILTQQGILVDYEQDRRFVFLSVEGCCTGKGTLFLPASECACMILAENELSAIPSLLAEKKVKTRFALCLNTDIYDYCLVHHLHRLEVQCPLEND